MTARTVARLVLLLLCLVTCPARSDVIAEWNMKADAVAADKSLTPAMQARGLAMLHVAMFEAVNAIEGRFTPYKLALRADPDASSAAAAAAAGYEVLVALYPDWKPDLDTSLSIMLAAIPASTSREQGIAVGKQAAEGILHLRANDGSDAAETYRPVTRPGVYTPTSIPASANVGAMTPWVMFRGSQFRPGPPPALDSPTWTRDVNEIREMGALGSTKRSAEQTDIARFWILNGGRSWNPVLRQVAQMKHLDLADSARLFALVQMAAADALIAVFDAKYTYNFWRPITAIRNADQTGNPATPRDASWLPLADTPMHPEYPCAHCICSTTVATVLQSLVGDEPGNEITMTSPNAPGVTRRWTRLQDYAREVSNARVFAGFHYRFSTEAGEDMARKIAALTVSTQLKPKTETGIGAEAGPGKRRELTLK